jgi:hypothetical protein
MSAFVGPPALRGERSRAIAGLGVATAAKFSACKGVVAAPCPPASDAGAGVVTSAPQPGQVVTLSSIFVPHFSHVIILSSSLINRRRSF